MSRNTVVNNCCSKRGGPFLSPPPDSHRLPRFPFNLEAPLLAPGCRPPWTLQTGKGVCWWHHSQACGGADTSCTQGGTHALREIRIKVTGPACLFRREDFRPLFSASEHRCVPAHLISLAGKTQETLYG